MPYRFGKAKLTKCNILISCSLKLVLEVFTFCVYQTFPHTKFVIKDNGFLFLRYYVKSAVFGSDMPNASETVLFYFVENNF